MQNQQQQLDKIRARIAQLSAREQQILARKSRQERADETRRSIVIGKRLEALAKNDRRAAAMMQTLIHDLENQFHYLFPAIWPNAQRPTKRGL